MGWIRSLYYPPQSQAATTAIEPADSANEVEDRKHVGIVLADVKPEFDAKKAARLARQSHGLAKIASPELLALSRASRAPVDPRDPPFIHPDEVAKHDNAEDGICELLKDVASADEPGIVVEDRVYDCTSFMNIHPGGPSMFEQFAGSQCTWQFWRFHRRPHLTDWSSSLLIGRTWPIPPNPYKEPPKWIRTS